MKPATSFSPQRFSRWRARAIQRLLLVLARLARWAQHVPRIASVLPGLLGNMARHWTPAMLDTVIRSRGARILADQPSTAAMPDSFAPRVNVAPDLALTQDQLRRFHEDGFLGPLRLCSPDEMRQRWLEIEPAAETPSRIYGFPTRRDRHLDCDAVLDLVRHPAVVERLAQLMGPDLLLWRSQILPKPPGFHETAWHQETTFTITGRSLAPVLIPRDINATFNLTAWIALEDVDTENGCPQFLRGSHREGIRTMRLWDSDQRFAQSRIAFFLEGEIDPARVVDVPLRAGEFLIFHGLTVHGARANTSTSRRRVGMNVRMCTPDVKVYSAIRVQRPFFFNEEFDLGRWGVVLVRGTDAFRVNRYADISLLERSVPARRELAAAY